MSRFYVSVKVNVYLGKKYLELGFVCFRFKWLGFTTKDEGTKE